MMSRTGASSQGRTYQMEISESSYRNATTTDVREVNISKDDDDDGPPGLDDADMSLSKDNLSKDPTADANSKRGFDSKPNAAATDKRTIQSSGSSASKSADNKNTNIPSSSKQLQQQSSQNDAITKNKKNSKGLNDDPSAMPTVSPKIAPIKGEETSTNRRRSQSNAKNLNNNRNQSASQKDNFNLYSDDRISKVDEVDTTKLGISKDRENNQSNRKQPYNNDDDEDEMNNDPMTISFNEKRNNADEEQYQEIYQYIDKINQSIRISNEMIDSIPKLQKSQRIIMQQIEQFEQAYRLQVEKPIEQDKNQKLSILSCLEEVIISKNETLKFMKDNEMLIEESNSQSKICSKMGKTLVDFHCIIQIELNRLKHYSKTLPTKEEIDYKEKMELLQKQLTQELEKRQRLEEELNKRVIDFQQLFCDAQEAKKIIRDQLCEIKEQKEKLKIQTEDLEKKQKEFKKQMSLQPVIQATSSNPSKEHQPKEVNDAESRKSDRTLHSHSITNVFRHKIATAKNQHMRGATGEEDMQQSQIVKRSKVDDKAEENPINSEDEEEHDDSFLVLNSDVLGAQKLDNNNVNISNSLIQEYKLDNKDTNLSKKMPQLDGSIDVGGSTKQQIMKQFAQLNDRTLDSSLQSQLDQKFSQQQQQSQLQAAQQATLQQQQQQIQGQQLQQQQQAAGGGASSQQQQQQLADGDQMNIKNAGQKGAAKSALKKKLSDHLNEDDNNGRQSANINISLFDFNVQVEEPKNYSLHNSKSTASYHNTNYSNYNKNISGGGNMPNNKNYNAGINQNFNNNTINIRNSIGSVMMPQIGQINSFEPPPTSLRSMIQSIQTQQPSLLREISAFPPKNIR